MKVCSSLRVVGSGIWTECWGVSVDWKRSLTVVAGKGTGWYWIVVSSRHYICRCYGCSFYAWYSILTLFYCSLLPCPDCDWPPFFGKSSNPAHHFPPVSGTFLPWAIMPVTCSEVWEKSFFEFEVVRWIQWGYLCWFPLKFAWKKVIRLLAWTDGIVGDFRWFRVRWMWLEFNWWIRLKRC